MSDKHTIRAVEPQEHRALSAIAFRSKAHWGYSTEFMEAARAELSVSNEDIMQAHCHYFLAESITGIAGFCAVLQTSSDECCVHALFVEPASIGKGIGRALMDHAKQLAKSLGAQSMVIQSDPNAAPFYIAAGGVHIGESESGSIAGRLLPQYRIFLDAPKTFQSRLIAVDCDGTFFDDAGYPSQRSCDVVERLVGRGHQIIAATGRSRFSLIKRMTSVPAIRYAVCSNGAYSWDIKQDVLMRDTKIESGVVTEVVERLRKAFANVAFNWESRDGIGSDDAFIDLAGGVDKVESGGRAGRLCEESLYKIKVRCPDVSVDALYAQALTILGDSLCEITTSGAPFIELSSLGVNKALGLQKLSDQLGFMSKDTIVFGDNHNDLAMFKWAGQSVAMGNAVDVIKQHATHQTLSNVDHGVAHYLENRLDAGTL